jgi:uncharacterized protein YjiS (DUF1127 family)
MKKLAVIMRALRLWQMKRARYDRTFKELSKLSNKELRDIGINRYDIDRIARGYHA